MKSKVYFSKSGSGSISGRITIPKTFLNIMKINEMEKEIDIKLSDDNSQIIIKKIETKQISNVTYDDMLKFILNNVEYTYNVAQCLDEFIYDMQMYGKEENTFYMTEDQEHFRINMHYVILNEGSEDEEIKYTFDVEKL